MKIAVHKIIIAILLPMLNILFAFFYLILIQPYKVDAVFISVVCMRETELGGV